MHIATMNNDVRMINMLVKFNGNIKATNSMNDTPMDIAKSNNNTEIITIFNEINAKYAPKVSKPSMPVSMIYNKSSSKRVSKLKKIDERKKLKTIDSLKSIEPTPKNADMSSEMFKFSDVIGNSPTKSYTGTTNDTLWDAFENNNSSTRSTSKYESILKTMKSTEYFSPTDMITSDDQLVLLSDYSINKGSDIENNASFPILNKNKRRSISIISNNNNNNTNNNPVSFTLFGYLDKLRMNKVPKIYEKKFVFVRDGHLIWNQNMIRFNPNIKLNSTEMKRYDGCISLLMVKDVTIYKSKKENVYKFAVYINYLNKKDIKHVFKCENKKQRDTWIYQLNLYRETLNDVINQF